MKIEEYIKVLKSVLKMQIEYIREDPRYEDFEYSEYMEGQESGLMIALDKIEASRFLIK